MFEIGGVAIDRKQWIIRRRQIHRVDIKRNIVIVRFDLISRGFRSRDTSKCARKEVVIDKGVHRGSRRE